jgi:putative flippase GtrA
MGPVAEQTERRGTRRGVREMSTLVRASISSGIATAADGVAYQLLLVLFTGSYGFAAFVGALLGGVTNFTINRRWAFASTGKRLRNQATEYAVASLVTYAALQTCLFVFIEVLHVDEHAAWVPAKLIAWLFVSYPVQRFLVFSGGSRLQAPVQDAPASERPPIVA